MSREMIPELASLRNCSNGGYRCHNASQLRSQKEYSLPDCEFHFVKKDAADTFSVRSIYNNEYFSFGHVLGFPSVIMTPADDSLTEHWKVGPVRDSPNTYTIQNVGNGGYMTAHAHSLHHGMPGDTERWYIESLVPDAEVSFWMTKNWNLIGSLKLDRICLPGSHDSGTFDAEIESKFGSVRVTRTQLFDIEMQLMQGVRAFDLRPFWYNAFYTAHYSKILVLGAQGALGVSLKKAFEQIAAFVDNAGTDHESRELIILDFSHFSAWDPVNKRVVEGAAGHQEEFTKLVVDILGHRLVCGASSDGLLKRTLGDLMAGGKNIIAVSPTFEPGDDQTGRGLWNKKQYFTTHGQYSDTDDLQTMRTTQAANLKSFSHADPPPFIFELCWQLTLSDFESTPAGTQSIIDLANRANPHLPNTVRGWMVGEMGGRITTNHYPNFINTDACLESVTQAVRLSIDINAKLMEDEEDEPMGQWTYVASDRQHPKDVYNEIFVAMNDETRKAYRKSMKVTFADVSGSNAKGVLIYFDQDQEAPSSPAGPWAVVTDWGDEYHLKDVYPKVVRYLNSNLSFEQAYYSLIGMTDHKGEHPTFALYYRLEAK